MKSWRVPSFLLLQATLLPLAMLAPFWRAGALHPKPLELSLNEQPARVEPLNDEPLVVSDEQLAAVLVKLQPRLGRERPQINHVDHALRFWGVEAEFSDPESLSGREMLELLTDHQKFVAAWGDASGSLLLARAEGFAVRTQQGSATASHVDHTLATLAECGCRLDHPIIGPDRRGAVRDMVRQAAASFAVDQQEYEWTTLVLALYAVDGLPWYTTEGDRVDFDRLVRRIMRQRYTQGVCFGNHRLFTLAMLLRIDDQKSLLSDEARAAARGHLAEATSRLVASQHPQGYWDRNWHDPAAPVGDTSMNDPLTRRLLATGHALEWWAMAPEELHPPREVLVRAGQWLVREIDQLNDDDVAKNYTFLTHVGRALSLWRGEFPAESWRRLRLDQWSRASAPAAPMETNDGQATEQTTSG